MTAVLAYVIAVAVPAFAIYLIFALDLFGTSRSSTALICIAWGATAAFGLAYLVNSVAQNVVSETRLLTLAAPITEELLKSLILIYFIRQSRFRYVVDGAVYGFAAGIGFAMAENLLYLVSTGGGLSLAISRVLSVSLMHGVASSLVGISLGRLRRSAHVGKIGWPLLGIGTAVAIHSLFNSTLIALRSDGTRLLITAIALGIGGGIEIGLLIAQGLAEEKKRFSQTLGLQVGVCVGERKAVQQLGGTAIEQIFHDLSLSFGEDNVALVRRLLGLQANIGILQNNLQGEVSPRLRAAWETEIASLRAEAQQVRAALGRYVMSYLRRVFPSRDATMWNAINHEMAEFDPTLVHTFDLFMRVSEMAEAFTPEQLQAMADRLSRIPLFQNVSLADLENLCRAITVSTFEDGQRLFDKGDEGDCMYLIEDGQIAIYTEDDEQTEKLFRVLKVGDVVGDFAVRVGLNTGLVALGEVGGNPDRNLRRWGMSSTWQRAPRRRLDYA